eukprot:scaffold9238_cov22-Prasinocladus_malaysianus.AAC.1
MKSADPARMASEPAFSAALSTNPPHLGSSVAIGINTPCWSPSHVNWDYSLATLAHYAVFAVLTIHWMACCWWYVGELEWLLYVEPNTWMVVGAAPLPRAELTACTTFAIRWGIVSGQAKQSDSLTWTGCLKCLTNVHAS